MVQLGTVPTGYRLQATGYLQATDTPILAQRIKQFEKNILIGQEFD